MHHHLRERSLQLAPHEISRLKLLTQAHRTPQALARRASMILLAHAHPDWHTKQLAAGVNRKERWVRKWRRRWQKKHTLTALPRSGAPPRFSAEVPAQVTALACSLPPAPARPPSHCSPP